ncbi:putative PGG domain-containing protein [Arabidopsis thaliana]
MYKEKGSNNNLLHLVARLPPPNRLQVVSGAALQMQREILWYKAVKEIVPRVYIKTKNKKEEVAHDLFTKEHDNLRKEGEKWMKETATACMLVSTLIATVVFAAAFTLPGGNDTSGDIKTLGFPTFRKEFWFEVFIISDSVALLSSVTSIMIFLSILTSRYAEASFQTNLPTKLMLGLLAFFVSIISMVLAFTATLILIRDQEPKWSLILLVYVASATALSFVVLHFQLWFDTLRSAYLSKFLFHGRKSGLYL